jgi:formylmethanofuran dehydrogenase subunit E
MRKTCSLRYNSEMKTLDEIAEFHGHTCPGLALGYRVAKLALQEMGERAGDEELVAVVENDSCAVDAVQVLTGCTFGKGNLFFHDYGKQVYTFFRRPSGKFLRIGVDWNPPAESAEETDAWKRYMDGDRSDDVLNLIHQRKSKKIQAVLDAKDEELFKLKRGVAIPPPEAHIYPSVRCEVCGEKVMEPRARLRNGKVVCLPCAQEQDCEAEG